MAGGDFKTDEEIRADNRLKEIIKQAIRETISEIMIEFKKVRSEVVGEEKTDGHP